MIENVEVSKQPDEGSVVLNRVVGNEQSVIDGAIEANGQMFVLNSNGVLGAATLSDADFQGDKKHSSAMPTAAMLLIKVRSPRKTAGMP